MKRGIAKQTVLMIIVAVVAVAVASYFVLRPILGRAAAFEASDEVNEFFSKAYPGKPSTADILGYNDWQRLPSDKTDDYGPQVRVYVSPVLKDLGSTEFGAGSNGAFVALLEVDGAPSGMPQTYKKLKINESSATLWYCIYLKLDTSHPADPWSGSIMDATPATGKCDEAGAKKLDAAGDADNGEGGATPDHFPPVARFGEDADGNLAIGVKCLAAWCEVGHKIAKNKEPSHPKKNKKEGRVKGWHDEQILAMPGKGTGSLKVHRGIRGTVTPVADLASKNIAATAGGLKVATIWLDPTSSEDPVNNRKYKAWGLQKGAETDVWIVVTNGNWEAQFVASGTTPTNATPRFIINRQQHPMSGPPIPGIARWFWKENDEDVWVACDQGCCEITGGESKLHGSS